MGNKADILKIHWIIDKDLYTEYENELVQSVINSGNKATLVEYENDADSIEAQLRKIIDIQNEIVVFYGSIEFGRKFFKMNYYPAIYLTFENYECYNYYGYYGDELLNSDYLMMGLNDVLRNKVKIFSHFDIYSRYSNKIFMRPSNGFKSFTGQCLSINNFDYDFDILTKSYGGLDMNTLVLLSDVNDIKKEYRFVIIDGEIISGCIYMDEENKGTNKPHYDKLTTDERVFEYVESVKDIYHPDRAFNMDICELEDGTFKVIEINSFSCGALYGNDLDKVVAAMNKLATDDYNDVYM